MRLLLFVEWRTGWVMVINRFGVASGLHETHQKQTQSENHWHGLCVWGFFLEPWNFSVSGSSFFPTLFVVFAVKIRGSSFFVGLVFVAMLFCISLVSRLLVFCIAL